MLDYATNENQPELDVCPVCDGDGNDELGNLCKECSGKGYVR